MLQSTDGLPNNLFSWLRNQRRSLRGTLKLIKAQQKRISQDVHILTLLDEANFQELFTLVKAQGRRGLNVDKFVSEVSLLIGNSLERSLDVEESQYVDQALRDLFVTIDSASDGVLDWEEFSSSILTNYVGQELPKSSILPYKLKRNTPPIKTAGVDSEVRYLPDVDQFLYMNAPPHPPSTVALINASSPELTPYASAAYPGQFLAVDYIPSKKLVVAAEGGNRLLYYRLNKTSISDGDVPQQSGCLSQLFLRRTHELHSMVLKMMWDSLTETLYLCTKDGQVLFWRTESEAKDDVPSVEAHVAGQINAIIGFPGHNPRRIGTAGSDGYVRFIDIYSKKILFEFQPEPNVSAASQTGVRSLSFSPDYMFIVTTGYSLKPAVWMPFNTKHRIVSHLEDGDRPHCHPLIGAQALAGTPQIITGDISGMFKVWDLRMTRVVQTFEVQPKMQTEHADLLRAASFTLDLKRHNIIANVLHSNTNTASFALYEPDQPPLPNPTVSHEGPVGSVHFDPNNTTFVTSSICDIKVWDAAKGNVLLHFANCTKSEISKVQLDVKGRQFIVGTHSGSVDVHSLGTGHLARNLHRHAKEVTFLHFDPRTLQTVSASQAGTVAFHQEGSPAHTVVVGQPVVAGHYNGVAGLVLLTDARGCVLVYDKQPAFLYCCWPGTPLGTVGWLPPEVMEAKRRRESSAVAAAALLRRPDASPGPRSPKSPPASPGPRPSSGADTAGRLEPRPLSASTGGRADPAGSPLSGIRGSGGSRPGTASKAENNRPGTASSSCPIRPGTGSRSRSHERPGTGSHIRSLSGGSVKDGRPGSSLSESWPRSSRPRDSSVDAQRLSADEDIPLTLASLQTIHDPSAPHQDLSQLSPAEMNYATDGQIHFYTHDSAARALAVGYLAPHPAFVAADTQAHFTLWGVRPLPYSPLARWKTAKVADAPFDPIVTDLAWHPGASLLFVADDQGYVSVWNLSALLLAHFSSSGGLADSGSFPGFRDASLQAHWRAHPSSLLSLTLLPAVRTVATTSSDGLACLWTFEGVLCGALQQGRGAPGALGLHAYTFAPLGLRPQPSTQGPPPQPLEKDAVLLGSVLDSSSSLNYAARSSVSFTAPETPALPQCPPPPPGTPRPQVTFRTGLVMNYQSDQGPVEEFSLEHSIKPLVGRCLSASSQLKRRDARSPSHSQPWPPLSCARCPIDTEALLMEAADVLLSERDAVGVVPRPPAAPYAAPNPVTLLAPPPASDVAGDVGHPDYAPSPNPLVGHAVRHFAPWVAQRDGRWGLPKPTSPPTSPLSPSTPLSMFAETRAGSGRVHVIPGCSPVSTPIHPPPCRPPSAPDTEDPFPSAAECSTGLPPLPASAGGRPTPSSSPPAVRAVRPPEATSSPRPECGRPQKEASKSPEAPPRQSSRWSAVDASTSAEGRPAAKQPRHIHALALLPPPQWKKQPRRPMYLATPTDDGMELAFTNRKALQPKDTPKSPSVGEAPPSPSAPVADCSAPPPEPQGDPPPPPRPAADILREWSSRLAPVQPAPPPSSWPADDGPRDCPFWAPPIGSEMAPLRTMSPPARHPRRIKPGASPQKDAEVAPARPTPPPPPPPDRVAEWVAALEQPRSLALLPRQPPQRPLVVRFTPPIRTQDHRGPPLPPARSSRARTRVRKRFQGDSGDESGDLDEEEPRPANGKPSSPGPSPAPHRRPPGPKVEAARRLRQRMLKYEAVLYDLRLSPDEVARRQSSLCSWGGGLAGDPDPGPA